LKLQPKIFLSYFLLPAACLLLLTSCYKKKFDELKLANASPEYLYPLIDAELSLKDIIDPTKKKLYITEDANGFYTFVYYQDVYEAYITDFLKIDDLAFNQSVSLTGGEIASLPVNTTITHSFTQSNTLDAENGEQLKHLTIKSGSIPLNLSSTFRHDIQLVITFPYIKKNNVALTKTVALNYNGSSPVVSNNTIDLSGYSIDLSENNTKVNTLTYTAALTVTYKAGSPINATQKLDVQTGLTGIQYQYADGYIGHYDINMPEDTLKIEIFDNAYAGNVYFTDPKVRAIIYNSIGAASSVKMNQLETYSNITGQTNITGSIINTNIPINYPAVSEIGQTKTTTIQLDKTNSNVQTVFNPAPDQVIYKMSGIINPGGVTTNFVTDTSKIRIRGEAEIPLEGKITQFVLLDTIEDISYPDIKVDGNDVTVLSAAFNLALVNGFPLNTNIQMYFLDDTGMIVDSLFSTPHFIASGSIDGNGKVTTPTTVQIKEIFDEARYKRVSTSSKAVIYAFFSSANNGTVPIKIYSSYKIKSNISINVKANVSF
jgi:hypothetical protein